MCARSIVHGPSVVRHGLTAAQRADDVERGFESLRPFAQRRVEDAELLLAATDRALQDERAARDRRERADLFGDQHGMPQRQQEQRARGPLVPLREQPTEDRDVLVVGHRHVVVVADEQAVEPGVGRGPRPLDHPLRPDPRVHGRVPTPERRPDVHSRQPRAKMDPWRLWNVTFPPSRNAAPSSAPSSSATTVPIRTAAECITSR